MGNTFELFILLNSLKHHLKFPNDAKNSSHCHDFHAIGCDLRRKLRPRRHAPNSKHQLARTRKNFSSCRFVFFFFLFLQLHHVEGGNCNMKRTCGLRTSLTSRFFLLHCAVQRNLWAGKLKNIIALRPGHRGTQATWMHKQKNFILTSLPTMRKKRLPFSCRAPFSDKKNVFMGLVAALGSFESDSGFQFSSPHTFQLLMHLGDNENTKKTLSENWKSFGSFIIALKLL